MVATKHCCYGLCKSDSRLLDKDSGIFFIGFGNGFPKPHKDPEKCNRWVQNCGRKYFTIDNVTKNTYICSLHFVGGMGPTAEHPDPIKCEIQTPTVNENTGGGFDWNEFIGTLSNTSRGNRKRLVDGGLKGDSRKKSTGKITVNQGAGKSKDVRISPRFKTHPFLIYLNEKQEAVLRKLFEQLTWDFHAEVLTTTEMELLDNHRKNLANTYVNKEGLAPRVSASNMGFQNNTGNNKAMAPNNGLPQFLLLPHGPNIPNFPLLVQSKPGPVVPNVNTESSVAANKVSSEGNEKDVVPEVQSQKPHTETLPGTIPVITNGIPIVLNPEPADNYVKTNLNYPKTLMNPCETIVKANVSDDSAKRKKISAHSSGLNKQVTVDEGAKQKPCSEAVLKRLKSAFLKTGALDGNDKTESDDQEALVSEGKAVDMDSEETDSCSETENSMNDSEVRRKKNKVRRKKNEVLVDIDKTDYVQQVLNSEALTSTNKSSDIDGSNMESGDKFETSTHENQPAMTFDHLDSENQDEMEISGHSYVSFNTYDANTENETLAHSSESFNTHDAIVKSETGSYATTTLTNENISETERNSEMFPVVKVEVEDEGYNQALNDGMQ